MIEIGVDDEGVRHCCKEGEEHLHTVDYMCGCNPDCLGGDYGLEDEFWCHWPLLRPNKR